jgi:peptidoglycan/xylan/chitin deacetylase (PgdA/CDA1 family)
MLPAYRSQYTPHPTGRAALTGCYTAPVHPPARLSSLAETLTAGYLHPGWTIAAGITAAGLAIGGYHYAALWPPSQVFGRSLIAGPDPSEVALTFDDGPNDPYTSQLLEVLARHQITAAFFVIGRFVRERPQIVRALHRAGHKVGSHTMTHPRLMYMGLEHIRAEIGAATALIEDTIGDQVRFFRPPFGSRHPGVFRVLAELRLTPVLWNVNARDWKASSAADIERRLEQGIRRNQRRTRGSNLLLHDGGHLTMGTDRRRTVTAVANLLAGAPRAGIRFVTLDHWLPAQPGDPLPL